MPEMFSLFVFFCSRQLGALCGESANYLQLSSSLSPPPSASLVIYILFSLAFSIRLSFLSSYTANHRLPRRATDHSLDTNEDIGTPLARSNPPSPSRPDRPGS